MLIRSILWTALLMAGLARLSWADTTEFCLTGEFDLGSRLQGMKPEPGEFRPAQMCVITEGQGNRVRFSARGHSNPDLEGEFTVTYLPPDRVRIVNANTPPDLDFVGTASLNEALRNRRIDPRRLAEEIQTHPDRLSPADEHGFREIRFTHAFEPVRVRITDGHIEVLQTHAELPLRGSVPVTWRWNWSQEDHPGMTLSVDGDELFQARGAWRTLEPDEADRVWKPTDDAPPRETEGANWPSRVAMRLETLAPGTHRVLGVRTGFHHLVIETDDGLVVADAPAGWVELHQIPPADLVGPLGLSGLSERFIDFLHNEFPGQRIRAVILTHAHDDHAGGARAFAAEGAEIHAPAAVSEFLESALNRDTMPPDRLTATGRRLRVHPVTDTVRIDDRTHPARIINLGAGPHASESLGVLAESTGYFFVSDIHVPTSQSPEPRADRIATECWFARRALDVLPPEMHIINSHTRIVTSTETLTGYLESTACQSAGLAREWRHGTP